MMMQLKSEVLKQQEQKSKERNTQRFKSLYITAVSFLVKKGKYPNNENYGTWVIWKKVIIKISKLDKHWTTILIVYVFFSE